MADKYHLTKRTRTVNGKRSVKWYYWYYDRYGNQIRKATKASNRKDAEKLVRNLNEGTRLENGDESLTLAEFSAGFFVRGCCPYIRRRREGSVPKAD